MKNTGKHKKTRRNVQGIISISRRGTGYVRSSHYDEDIEIRRESLNTALNGDFVPVLARIGTRLNEHDSIEIVTPRQGG